MASSEGKLTKQEENKYMWVNHLAKTQISFPSKKKSLKLNENFMGQRPNFEEKN